MIHTTPVRMITEPGRPTLYVNQRADLTCGCACWVGKRSDNWEVASAALPCSAEHLGLVEHFNLLLKEGLVEPSDRLLIEVIDDLLGEAERNWQVAA